MIGTMPPRSTDPRVGIIPGIVLAVVVGGAAIVFLGEVGIAVAVEETYRLVLQGN